MLQQTQVGRVASVFERFMVRFPTPLALATATRADVIDAWSDLGYLRRAVNLHGAAAHLAEHGWPPPSELEQLPGVGPYTAAAVASIAFDVQAPAIDTNVRRVLSRWTGRPLTGVDLRTVARSELGEAPASEWNQAIMDLSASLCRRQRPRCAECPVERWCADPTVKVSVGQQSAFEGSVRQARAAALKRLAKDGAHRVDDLAEIDGVAPEKLRSALEALERERIVTIDGDVVRLT